MSVEMTSGWFSVVLVVVQSYMVWTLWRLIKVKMEKIRTVEGVRTFKSVEDRLLALERRLNDLEKHVGKMDEALARVELSSPSLQNISKMPTGNWRAKSGDAEDP